MLSGSVRSRCGTLASGFLCGVLVKLMRSPTPVAEGALLALPSVDDRHDALVSAPSELFTDEVLPELPLSRSPRVREEAVARASKRWSAS